VVNERRAFCPGDAALLHDRFRDAPIMVVMKTPGNAAPVTPLAARPIK
jgi:hypothetical protein